MLFFSILWDLQSSFPEAKKLFLSKVHQYIKDRLLDAKYACAFLFNVVGSPPSEFEEVSMLDLIFCNYSLFYSIAHCASCTCGNFDGLLARS